MRSMPIFLVLVTAVPAVAAPRTWTIATQVETREADLVAVRGETVYLKVGEQIQQVPLARLSAADHKYLASLALAPVLPGPADDEELGVVSPLTGDEPAVVQAAGISGPVLVPPIEPIEPASATIEEEGLPMPAGAVQASAPSRATGPPANYQLPPQASGQYRATSTDPRNSDDDSRRARRWQQQQQENANSRTNTQRNSDTRRRGLFFRRGN